LRKYRAGLFESKAGTFLKLNILANICNFSDVGTINVNRIWILILYSRYTIVNSRSFLIRISNTGTEGKTGKIEQPLHPRSLTRRCASPHRPRQCAGGGRTVAWRGDISHGTEPTPLSASLCSRNLSIRDSDVRVGSPSST